MAEKQKPQPPKLFAPHVLVAGEWLRDVTMPELPLADALHTYSQALMDLNAKYHRIVAKLRPVVKITERQKRRGARRAERRREDAPTRSSEPGVRGVPIKVSAYDSIGWGRWGDARPGVGLQGRGK